MSFNEASELSYYGAEVLHPSTLIPAMAKKIPARVAHALKPEEALLEASADLEKIGTVSFEKNKTLICVVGEELEGNPKVLGDIFTAVGKAEIKAGMVSQSASEINIAFLVDNSQITDTIINLHNILIKA